MSRASFTSGQIPELRKQYEAGATYRELGAEYGCSDITVRNTLARARVPLRTTSESRTLRRRWGPDVADEAIEQYRSGWSVHGLAKHWGVRTVEISELLAARQEPLHPGGRAHPRFRTVRQCEEVAEVYRSGLSLAETARKFKCTTPTIANALRRVGVELRLGRPQFWSPELLQWIGEQYEAGRSQQDIADEIGINQTAVSGRLRQMGIIATPERPKGTDHHSWTGGRTGAPGGYVWVTPFRDDLHYCRPGGNGYVLEHRLVMGRKLGRPLTTTETVHHINGDRTDNRPENLQLRQGRHGKGVVMTCNSCGSHDVQAIEIAT
jgi:transposase-like protein